MRYSVLSAVAPVALAVGCSGSSAKLGNSVTPPTTQFVTGTVTMNGRPVTGLMIEFEMTNGMSSQTMMGLLDSAGQYKVQLPDGSYVAFFTATVVNPADLEKAMSILQSIPMKYRKAKDSPLRFEMKPGGPRTFDIVLTP